MKRYWRISFACFCGLLLVAGAVFARPAGQAQQVAEPETEVDIVGDVDGTNPMPQKALQDTVWIADWSFDAGGLCSETNWTHVDNHVLNDGSNYWHIETGLTSVAGIAGNSYAVGYHNNNCCEDLDGYDNDWYQAVKITYTGAATISLDYMVDSEAGFDFLQIETDSLCLSFARVDFNTDPSGSAATYRTLEVSADGVDTNGEWNNQALSNYGGGTHCCYIAFFADGGYSPCDGLNATTIGEGAVIDNISITDGGGTRTENFTDGTLDIGVSLNLADSVPFGTWARLYQHITDNDICSENSTCAWLATDHITPTLFNDPSMSFAPGGFVIRSWLDDIIVSPWVSLATTPTASGTVLQFRRFPGNNFNTGAIVQNWSVRGRGDIGGQACITGWGHASNWNSLGLFRWVTSTFDMSPNFDPTSEDVQIRFRVSDWQWIADSGPPSPFVPGPGPFWDRAKIGRRVLTGPVMNEGIDSRTQGQDCFPTEIHPGVTPAGEHYRPTTDRFGTCAFSEGTELGINASSPNLITGDSIQCQVRGVRVGGETITAVTWYGAIVAGPHAGKAPAPYAVGGNGFFSFPADSARTTTGSVVRDFYTVDLDDTYFRGGDVLQYVWTATDNGGGFSSTPTGLTAVPTSIAQAQTATAGLHEVNFLPTINWAPAFVARIQADPNGDLTPTAGELAASTQKNCILYAQLALNARRRSGDVNRTSFMFALDRLGYRGWYDTYDTQGYGNSNNQLGGRATVEQCQGYNLIVYDAGDNGPGFPLLPDGVELDASKVDQAGWFQDWLAQASISQAGFSTLWIVGSNVVQEKNTHALVTGNMGVSMTNTDQGLNVNPNVDGQASFTFDQAAGQATVDFTPDLFAVNGGCPTISNYDGIDAQGGTSVRTHRYRSPTTGALGAGAIVMNRNNAGAYNTIMMTFPFFDIRDNAGTPDATPPELELLGDVLGGILPAACLKSPQATDTGEGNELDVPRQTALHQNVPNPFNPMTKISFDLAQSGKVSLRIYDVAGRLVRTLIDQEKSAGRYNETWNGLDDQGSRVASGVYFYRLDAVGTSLTRKMVVMK